MTPAKTLLALVAALVVGCAHTTADQQPQRKDNPLTEGLPHNNGLIAESECGGLHWAQSRLPLKVMFVDDVSANIWGGTLQLSVNWWGGGLFQIVTAEQLIAKGEMPDIMVAADPEFVGAAVTFMNYNKNTCVMRNAMIIVPLLPGNAATHMMSHELGHALGLDHDANPYSLMYPTVLEAELPANDRAKLEELYGQPPFALP